MMQIALVKAQPHNFLIRKPGNNKAPVQNAPIYSMGQMAVVGDMEISVEDVYATNVIKSTDPDFQSQIYDDLDSTCETSK